MVLNINETEIVSAKKRKSKKQELEQEVQDLRSEMSEIKSLLQQWSEVFFGKVIAQPLRVAIYELFIMSSVNNKGQR